MIMIKNVTTISSHKGELTLHTDSGVDIRISCEDSPGYINLASFLDEDDENVLSIDVVINWDR